MSAVPAHTVETAFHSWAHAVGLAQKLRTIRMSRSQDGEAFAVLAIGLRLATGPMSGGLMLLVYGLHTRRKFEMALGSETNEPVNQTSVKSGV